MKPVFIPLFFALLEMFLFSAIIWGCFFVEFPQKNLEERSWRSKSGVTFVLYRYNFNDWTGRATDWCILRLSSSVNFRLKWTVQEYGTGKGWEFCFSEQSDGLASWSTSNGMVTDLFKIGKPGGSGMTKL